MILKRGTLTTDHSGEDKLYHNLQDQSRHSGLVFFSFLSSFDSECLIKFMYLLSFIERLLNII